ncbi:MAG: hypothetical protein SGPRY_014584, partial [Prymnesium sp.]
MDTLSHLPCDTHQGLLREPKASATCQGRTSEVGGHGLAVGKGLTTPTTRSPKISEGCEIVVALMRLRTLALRAKTGHPLACAGGEDESSRYGGQHGTSKRVGVTFKKEEPSLIEVMRSDAYPSSKNIPQELALPNSWPCPTI